MFDGIEANLNWKYVFQGTGYFSVNSVNEDFCYYQKF